MIPVLLFLAGLAAAQAQPASEPLRGRVEQLHEDKDRTVRSVRLLQPDAVSHFFQAGNFTFVDPSRSLD